MSQGVGILYVVATPIGNLEDLTERAARILGQVDLIAAEDTRVTRRLLTHLGLSTPILAYHDHNEATAAGRLLALLESGQTIALVSDAGTPLISDPGFALVAGAWKQGVRVIPIPGASAPLCALAASGLPTDRFLFLGFPPRTPGQRRDWLAAAAAEPGTLILLESPKRAAATLADIAAVLGDARRVVLARELTKYFETLLAGSSSELVARLEQDPEQRLGELVILIEGRRTVDQAANADEQLRIVRILASELPLRQAASLAARITGGNTNQLYRQAMALALEGERGTDSV